jgi:beta-galactosidase/beta-glucuronidase
MVSANGALPADGDAATGVLITTDVLLSNTATSNLATAADGFTFTVCVQIFDTMGSGAVVSTTTSLPITVGAGENKTVEITAVTPSSDSINTTIAGSGPSTKMQLWSVARPYLYTAVITVNTAAGVAVDTQNVTFGARKVVLDANTGMFLNNRKVKLRGFCDHSQGARLSMHHGF